MKSDLDDSSYALMREVSSMGVGMVGAVTGTQKVQGVWVGVWGVGKKFRGGEVL